ncbi:recombinase family protein [Bacillus sp. AFS037270]|uniref:recombinase family protein n=1 Tax=Bacillus sp. AFS037270 TaxID=2033499 RepID=UPI000BFCC4BC|nr:recombinase family protein [Bacillus sp. AFS037270]PGV52481.1 recombinase [Bacillus sp. AFS037270]
MATGQKKLVAIYVRKSRLKDADAIEIDRQLELLTDYADKNNMEYEVFAEEGSSEDWNRPEFQRMLMDLKRNIYDGVLCTDQDRITRDRTDFGLFVRFMKAEALQFYTLNKTYNFMNDEDVFVTGIQSEMDNHFMRMTKRKLRRGRIQAIQKGVYFGIAPYGYTKDEAKHLLPHPTEAKIVEDIFDMYVNQGLNQAEICEQLTLRGIKTRSGKNFTPRATSLILSNVAYRGIVHYELQGEDAITVEEAHPALVDADTYNKAQEIRAKKRAVPQKSQRGIYTLSKLLVCPSCGQTLSFCNKYVSRSSRKTLDKSQRELYLLNCYSSMSQRAKQEFTGERCKNNATKASRVEEVIFSKLKGHLTDLDEKIEAIIAGDTSFLSSVAKKQQELTLQYNKLEEQKKRVQDGFKAGIYEAEEASEEIKNIKEQQLQINKELQGLEGADAKSVVDKHKKAKAKIEMLLSMDTDANPTKANKLLHDVIDKVYYWKEQSDRDGKPKSFEIRIVYKGEES